MSDYLPHPDDTVDQHIKAATEALLGSKPTNRYYIFPMSDRVEIAFGNARHVNAPSGTGQPSDGFFKIEFHSSISMEIALLRDFSERLAMLLAAMDEQDV